MIITDFNEMTILEVISICKKNNVSVVLNDGKILKFENN